MPSLLQYLVEQFAEGVRQSAAAQRSALQSGATVSGADNARRAPYVPQTSAPIAPPPDRRGAGSAVPRDPALASTRSPTSASRASTPALASPQGSAAPGLAEPPAGDPVLPVIAGGAPVRLRDAIVAAEILGKPLALRDW